MSKLTELSKETDDLLSEIAKIDIQIGAEKEKHQEKLDNFANDRKALVTARKDKFKQIATIITSEAEKHNQESKKQL